MDQTVLNYERSHEYFEVSENGTSYKLQLIFQDNMEGDKEWINLIVAAPQGSCQQNLVEAWNTQTQIINIFIFICRTVSSLYVMLLKVSIIKYIRKNM